MSISKTYDPSQSESRWYSHWNDRGYFHSEPDERTPYTIVIPPPNVTGVLHMGHSLNNTIQDVLIRRARMQGFNACWVPGTDHASIATEAKVVAMLRERGIDKKSLSREEFLEYAWEWREKYGGIILEQLKKMGASCDWERTNFTMDPDYYRSVIWVFNDLYEKGLIYRGTRLINWDPQAKTALSDEEVIHREVQAGFYYLNYKVEDGNGEGITIATVRPETILGDSAIAVHPEDERYKHLIGKKVLIPLIHRAIPIIADEYVDREFGSGALKITPAHDKNDYALGQKHNLPIIDILNADGTLNERAQILVGEDRFKARKKIIELLREEGSLIKEEQITSNVGYSERSNAVVEPRLSLQWFCHMPELAKPALEAVMKDEIRYYPERFKNLYRHWMENIQDWCISRQLYWGHRIPAWYLPDGSFVVAMDEKEALEKAKAQSGDQSLTLDKLKQEEDVLDTWFSSWLWPIEVFKGISQPNNKEINYYYPTQTLVTAPEIIFFWVARMIMVGYEYRQERPFDRVYFTGIVRDKIGRKMSKQFGNSPDLLKLIEDNGADAVRFGILVSSPAGSDLLFDEKLIEQGRNFANKLWNALRLVKSWEEGGRIAEGDADDRCEKPIAWFRNQLDATIRQTEDHYRDFRISDVVTALYKLAWDDFCSWYLEMVKPAQEAQMSRNTYEETVRYFEEILQLLHPLMPFITEEIWHQLQNRREGEDIIISEYPQPLGSVVEDATAPIILELITQIRGLRSQNGLSPRVPLNLVIRSAQPAPYHQWEPTLRKLANLETISFDTEAPANSRSILIRSDEFNVYGDALQTQDSGLERDKLIEELNYTRGFLESVEKKLGNERFVQNAKPELVERERAKQADALAKIKALEENLSRLAESH